MKTLKVSLIVTIALIGFIGTACEHCDDEDYRRDEIEKNTTSDITVDSVDVSQNQ
jgi:hypothetical protein